MDGEQNSTEWPRGWGSAFEPNHPNRCCLVLETDAPACIMEDAWGDTPSFPWLTCAEFVSNGDDSRPVEITTSRDEDYQTGTITRIIIPRECIKFTRPSSPFWTDLDRMERYVRKLPLIFQMIDATAQNKELCDLAISEGCSKSFYSMHKQFQTETRLLYAIDMHRSKIPACDWWWLKRIEEDSPLWTPQVLKLIKSRVPFEVAVSVIPSRYVDPTMVKQLHEAVLANLDLFKNVPQIHQSFEMAKAAVSANAHNFEYVACKHCRRRLIRFLPEEQAMEELVTPVSKYCIHSPAPA